MWSFNSSILVGILALMFVFCAGQVENTTVQSAFQLNDHLPKFYHPHNKSRHVHTEPNQSVAHESMSTLIHIILGSLGAAVLVALSSSFVCILVIAAMEQRQENEYRRQARERLESPYYTYIPSSNSPKGQKSGVNGQNGQICSQLANDPRFRRPQVGPFAAFDPNFRPQPPTRFYFPPSLYQPVGAAEATGGRTAVESTTVNLQSMPLLAAQQPNLLMPTIPPAVRLIGQPPTPQRPSPALPQIPTYTDG